MLVLSPLNLSNIPPQNFCLERVTSVTSGPPGRFYINVATGFVECWNGATTLVIGSPQSVLANSNTLALRDGSGNLTATTFNGALNGNAATSSVSANAMLLGSQNGAFYLARANGTGTQLSNTISDLTANIRFNSLDLMTPPAADVNWNQFGIINLSDPVNPQDATNKRYVDANVSLVESSYLSKAVYDPFSTGTVQYALTSTLLAGVSPSYYLNRSNHSGTQLASSISNFVGAVQSVTLDTMSPPLTVVNLNGQKITLLGSPGIGTDAANKAYVDNAIGAIPPPQWGSLISIPPLRGTFAALPTIGDTSAPQQTEAEGYDHYYFMSTSGWRRVLSIPFRQWVTAPASSSAVGTLGQSAFDSNFFYICTANNVWKRVALSTWAGGTPFVATSSAPAGYTYTDGSYFYISVAVGTWLRFVIGSFSGVATGAPVPTQSYYPGLIGTETLDVANSFWYVCTGQNVWARSALTSF